MDVPPHRGVTLPYLPAAEFLVVPKNIKGLTHKALFLSLLLENIPSCLPVKEESESGMTKTVP